jgi:hypothetical protein
MLSGTFWPAHPRPLPDELLSSWIVRIAEANGIKLYTLTLGLFGDRLTPWQRDIDRQAPKWLLKKICAKTGVGYWDAYHTTLTGYRTRLYPRRQRSGQLRWILPISTFGLDRRGYGQQFCPKCLAQDASPYFRRCWRVSFFTFCPTHGCMLLDACHACGAPVALHRRDIGRSLAESKGLAHCQKCGVDYRTVSPRQATGADNQEHSMHKELLHMVMGNANALSLYNLGFLAVLHQLCKVLGSSANAGRLRRWIETQLGGTVVVSSTPRRRATFEGYRIDERHAIASLALWLLCDLPLRLTAAWRDKAVRFNHLLKDFDQPPRWYADVCTPLKRPMTLRRSEYVHSFS